MQPISIKSLFFVATLGKMLSSARAFGRPTGSTAMSLRGGTSNSGGPGGSLSRNQATRLFAVRSALKEVSKDGEFKRKDSAWRDWITTDPNAKFPAEKDRYHLFVAYACPWAHRALMTRAIKGLEDVISVTVVHPIWQPTRPEKDDHAGWVFGNSDGEALTNANGQGGPFPAAFPKNDPEPFYGSNSIRELYERAGDIDGKYTVPCLWDKKENTIVNNESSDIIVMLNQAFNSFAKKPDLNLAPKELEDSMKSVDDFIYPTINNGVYRCGFATSQGAYDKAITELTGSFDRVESILSKQRYIAGNQFTLSDIRLFVTLVRFDEVYTVYFKTNTRRVMDSPALLNYCREIYQMPGVKETVDMEQIKAHYYCSHPILNPYSVIPRGPDFLRLLEKPHNRNAM